MARLLICRTCGTAMKMRDYHGDVNNDWELKEMVDRHLGKAADPRPESHDSSLFLVDDDDLALMSNEQLNDALSNDLDVQIGEFRDDFKDQAMQCYQLHSRPKGTCRDWKDESRVLGRKAGVPPTERAYLCSYCPVSVHMETRVNLKKGLYLK